jgi:integrase
VLADLEGKGRRIRTVAVSIWVKKGIDAWMTEAEIDKGRLLRSVSKSGKVNRESLNDWAVWSVVEQSSKQIGIEHFGAHDLRRTCAARAAAIWNRLSFCSDTRPSRRRSATLGPIRRLPWR